MPSTNPIGPDLTDLRIGGMEAHYYVLCPRKLWWSAHGLAQEHAGGNTGQDNVAIGGLMHEQTYRDKTKKDILIDDLLRLDFTDAGQVHEVKKSRGALKATHFQLLYYLWYLKHQKGVVTTGVIDFPKLRKKETVELTPELETEVEVMLEGVRQTREQPTPPVVAKPMALCRKCAYQELCWG